MEIQGSKILVLGGYGLVGRAVCHRLLGRKPREIRIHSLQAEEAEEAKRELAAEADGVRLSTAAGDIFAVAEEAPREERLRLQLDLLADADFERFLLHRLLVEYSPEIVVDCVNTATGIAYRNVFRTSARVRALLAEGKDDRETTEDLLEALYVPRLIRHLQVLYRGMRKAGTGMYLKVGTSGTGGMGLNVPYTHSEERPSRVLLSKSAVAGAHSMLLFLMARTPGAPITKEIKPAAAIAWKSIAHGPVVRRGRAIQRVEATPRPLGPTLSSHDPAAARLLEAPYQTVYIDTGENGIFSLEEFALLTTAAQMEFVTPEEIADCLVFEIEGGNTGHDVINALDNAVLGPTYRAGLLRHWALERMNRLEKAGTTRSVAFEMLGPPHNSKLLFEAHLLREAFGTMTAVRNTPPEAVAEALRRLVVERPEVANDVVAVGIPILLDDATLIRGPELIVPADAEDEEVTPESRERWVEDGWVDLRPANCARWIERFKRIHDETESIPEGDSSSRYLRTRDFWQEDFMIQPGKVVGWILSVEEQGARMKG
jgi:hypothetical protein